jgi:hypothetical protein
MKIAKKTAERNRCPSAMIYPAVSLPSPFETINLMSTACNE